VTVTELVGVPEHVGLAVIVLVALGVMLLVGELE